MVTIEVKNMQKTTVEMIPNNEYKSIFRIWYSEIEDLNISNLVHVSHLYVEQPIGTITDSEIIKKGRKMHIQIFKVIRNIVPKDYILKTVTKLSPIKWYEEVEYGDSLNN